MNALRARLLEAFEVEYREHLEVMRRLLSEAAGAGPEGAGFDLKEATRRAHSLKGAARAVGLPQVEALAHRLESMFIQVGHGELALESDLVRMLADLLDEIEDGVAAGDEAPVGDKPAEAAAPAFPSVNGEVKPAGETRRRESAPPPAATRSPAASPVRAPRAADGFVRVDAENLDQLLKSAGELHADMLYQNVGAQEVLRLSKDMAALDGLWQATWKRLEADLRGSAGGRSRALEVGAELTSLVREFSKRLRATSERQRGGARTLHHHLGDLERRVRATRMMPAESVFGSFRKMIRDLAGDEGKQVDAVVEGLACQADRLVLQRVRDPVMHLLRNAVSHGIESPAERADRGKPARGTVTLRVSNAHDRLSVTIEDDGNGIDFARIAQQAVSTGRLSREEAEAADHDTLLELVFEEGFSTAGSVTTISGRGVGLSIAQDTVSGLQGTLNVHSAPGAGTRIELSLPVSVLSQRLLLVSFKGQNYALPTDTIARVLRVGDDDLVTVEGRPAVRRADATLPLVSIGELLGSGDPVVATSGAGVCVVVVRGGAPGAAASVTHMGIAVEEFLGVNDFVVRNLEAGRNEARLWSGIILTEEGAPCLVLNPAAMARRDIAGVDAVFREKDGEAERQRSVLVVDDSITTRTLEKSILEAHGYRVRLSVDGRAALAILRTDPPDVVVSDIEMPQLDGFELVREMKNDAALERIPVILVTSRADDADRQRGLQLGADAYVVKQRFDQNELLRTIEQVMRA